jgi:hypothetical protein
MTTFNIRHLSLKWGTSRGRDTCGYNIVTLSDHRTGKKYRTCGGGYDMQGTVFGEWLGQVYQNELQQHIAKLPLIDAGYVTKGYRKVDGLYGLVINPDGKIVLDGACGTKSMLTIARAIGLDVQQDYDRSPRRNGLQGFFVSYGE